MSTAIRRLLITLVCNIALVLTVGVSAQADDVTLNGSVWVGVTATSATIAAVPLTPPDVTFTLNTSTGINMACYTDACYTLGDFLTIDSTPSATNIVENTPGSLAAPLSPPGPWGPGDIFTFTGTINITNGEVFSITQDDGVSIYINGGLIPGGFSGITAPVPTTVTYTGPTLTGATLEIVYGECCGAPAVLQTNLPTGGNTVPEPCTVSLLLLGSGVVGAIRAKRSRRAA